MMGITSPTGSHLPILEAEVAKLAPDSLVFEHGAGLYSTPLLARSAVSVLCAEEHEGWREWAQWLYQGRVEILELAKRVVPRLPGVSLAFIDGEAKNRGWLIEKCIEARVPTIIAHDTEPGHWQYYGHSERIFTAPAYAITQDNEPHRTTLWTLRR